MTAIFFSYCINMPSKLFKNIQKQQKKKIDTKQ